jgi:shikimate dehydrogenase
MKKIVLIGSNIAHSLSPRLHNHLFNLFDLAYRYELLPLEGDMVHSSIEEMKRGGYRGANVTSPHKELAFTAMDRLSPEAEAIRAINTIVFDDGIAVGHNTDAPAILQSLHGSARLTSPFTAAVIGTGGAAAAAVYAVRQLQQLDRLTIYSRDDRKAKAIAARWNDPRVIGSLLDAFAPADLVIHATPVGLRDNEGSVLYQEQLTDVDVLFEMIYSPAETELVGHARNAGAEIIPGLTMFLHQALLSFELWTGIQASLDDIPSSLLELYGQQ